MNDYSSRFFQSPEESITGKSVVAEAGRNFFAPDAPIKTWPYSLSDFLQSFIGKKVQVHYMPSNGKECDKQGKLIVTGSNFIGIQPDGTGDLFIIELSFIRSINIIGYNTSYH